MIGWAIISTILSAIAMLLMLYMSITYGLLLFGIVILCWIVVLILVFRHKKGVSDVAVRDLGPQKSRIQGRIQVNGKSLYGAICMLHKKGIGIQHDEDFWPCFFTAMKNVKVTGEQVSMQVRDVGQVKIFCSRSITRKMLVSALEKAGKLKNREIIK